MELVNRRVVVTMTLQPVITSWISVVVEAIHLS